MRLRLRRADDPDAIDDIAEVDARVFEGAPFPADSEWWVLGDDPEDGYCGARLAHVDGANIVTLTRGYVGPDQRGEGWQKRMVRARLRWGKALGAERASTYTWHDNVASMRSLIACGFKPAVCSDGWITWERKL